MPRTLPSVQLQQGGDGVTAPRDIGQIIADAKAAH